MRILVVENDAVNAEFAVASLEGEGHEIVIEPNGLRALERGQNETFDLILLDITLPGLDGGEICRRLRQGGSTLPIVALTASALREQVDRLASAGFSEILTKPISHTALRRAVARYGGGLPG